VKAQQEREAAVIRAEGEAASEAALKISLALEKAGEAFLALRKIEASKAIAQSLSMNGNVTYIPGGGSGGGNVLLNIPAPK
jgi:prohibitin 1